MYNPKYCKQCGCYIPDDMDMCLACGKDYNYNIKNEIYIENAYRYLETLYSEYSEKSKLCRSLKEQPIDFYCCKNCCSYNNDKSQCVIHRFKVMSEDDVCDDFFRKQEYY